MSVAELREWFVAAGDPYQAPEQKRTSGLTGKVYGHPSDGGVDGLTDGTLIQLGLVVAVEGRVVTIEGTDVKYRLMDPEPGYVTWLESQGTPLDEKEPFKLKKGVDSSDDTAEELDLSGPVVHLFDVSASMAQAWLDACWPAECWAEGCSATGVVVLLMDDDENIAGLTGCEKHRGVIDVYVEKNSEGVSGVDVGVAPRRQR